VSGGTTDAGAVEAYLAGLVSYEHSGRLDHPTTERVAALVASLGDPHRAYPVIHVTGTNGKGSTTAMISGLLSAQGLRVGTYTSPHLERINERIAIDGAPVGDDELAAAVSRVAQAAARTGTEPSWFEAVTAAGLWLLADRAVDVAVVEVGMLGRWDATNVVDAAVAVVTNVELDHTDMAGPTRAAIAAEKAGIIKAGSTLILGEADPALRPIFDAEGPARVLAVGHELLWDNRRADPTGSLVDLTTPWGVRTGVRVGLVGEHQCHNALLALSAAEAFVGRALTASTIEAALAATRVAGRFEVVGSEPAVVIDGAHNAAGAAALRQAIQETFPSAVPKVLLYGALTGRDPVEFLAQVGLGPGHVVVATEPASPRAVPAATLVAAAQSLGARAMAVAVPEQALEVAVTVAGDRGVVVAAGSLYLVGALRAAAARSSLAGRP
jgi:dihydrofolate synthase / folylpolyglutamate synthase